MRRALIGMVAAVALSGLAVGCGSTNRSASPVAAPSASASRVFLTEFVDADGRVVRRDQGGDTVSEGQAYAMLLDVAADDRAQFTTVWQWSEAHLIQPDGLLAYHWQDGRVADRNAATDADLDVARALILAGAKWTVPAYTSAGARYAAAILAHETAPADGRLWLTAGPWARTAPYYVDPSYYDPATFELLQRTTGDARWGEVAATSAAVISADTDGGTRLPSDWAQVEASGHIEASSPPGGGPVRYGYDAFRTLIRQADDCRDGTGRTIATRLTDLVERTASPADRADTYNQDGTPSEAGDNPLMALAAAASAHLSGQSAAALAYLDQAGTAAHTHPSYFLDAWVALAENLQTSNSLTGCSP